MRKTQFPIAVYMLAVFLSGSLVGAFAHRLYTVRTVTADTRKRSHAEFRQKYVREMQSRLQLDDTQTQHLNQILDGTRARFDAFNEKHRSELRGIHEEQTRTIRAMLSESQQAEFEKVLKEREERKRKEGDRRP